MLRTVVAFSNDKLRNTITDTLERNGIQVHVACKTGLEVLRYIKRMGGGVVICSPRLSDMTADELADELSDIAFFLVAGRPGDLDICENENLFRLSLPASSGEIYGSARILVELDERRNHDTRPERSKEEKDIIQSAKQLIMGRNQMSEDQAYRFLQKRSMESSTPMVEVAKMFLNALDSTDL